MTQFMPKGAFEWMPDDEIENFMEKDFLQIGEENPKGYILEVDLEYPQSLHDKHNDFPLAPESLTITPEMLSPFQNKYYPHSYQEKSVKLTPNLFDKKNYVCHYRNLQFYLNQGMKLTKTHRILSFDQSSWLRTYIEFNTEKRKGSASKYAKDFFKLMNNGFYGKTQENVRHRMRVKIVHEKAAALKEIAKANFKRSLNIREDLTIIHSATSILRLYKPIYLGFSVLDLSKLNMYQFHYDTMLKWYPDAELAFMDTDSFLYKIKTQNLYSDLRMSDKNDEFDFSEFPEGKDGHYLYNDRNKKRMGKMKDELHGRILREFVGLRPKCYSILFDGIVVKNKITKKNVVKSWERGEKRKSKGVSKNIVQRFLRHDHYKKVHRQLGSVVVRQNKFASTNHHLKTVHQRKIALTAFDVKRWVRGDNIRTYAHGHYRTRPTNDVALASSSPAAPVPSAHCPVPHLG